MRDLADANEIELLNLANPLGLKKRIPYIIRGAKYVVENYDGIVPRTIEDLLIVPGIGKYTATAIVTFAYGDLLVPADVNVFRFLARFTGLDIGHKTKGSKELLNLLPLLSQEKTKLTAEVLIDFSRLICGPRKPNCHLCSLTQKCMYFNTQYKHDINARC
jgi:A/G-specific adenine glycosylase